MRVIVTDNYMDAQRVYPNDRIITQNHQVIDLPQGTEVVIHRVAIGALRDGAIKTARLFIDREILKGGAA